MTANYNNRRLVEMAVEGEESSKEMGGLITCLIQPKVNTAVTKVT